jgi:hypothetical protein
MKEQRIDGDIFLSMSNDDVKQVAPKLGDKVRLMRVQESITRVVSFKLTCEPADSSHPPLCLVCSFPGTWYMVEV